MAASTEEICDRDDSPQLPLSDTSDNTIQGTILSASTQLEVNTKPTESSTIPSKSSRELSTDSQAKSTNDQLVKALHAVLEDEGFKFQSKAAMEAREAAVLMLEWATKQENLPVQMKFLQQLQEKFKNCLKFLNPASINKIRLWQSFFYFVHQTSL